MLMQLNILYRPKLHININFDTTLFAIDTCLMMVDNNLKNLEHKVQIELKKLTLGSAKISYP